MKLRLIFGSVIFALLYSGCAAAEGVALGDMAKTLLVGGGILTKLMWAVCIVVGIALIAAAFTQFQIHRRNPKLVPLTTPVLYLILGIVAIAIPFVGQVEGFLSKGHPGIRNAPAKPIVPPSAPGKPAKQYDPNDIDAPIY
jgi:hypothetical protein